MDQLYQAHNINWNLNGTQPRFSVSKKWFGQIGGAESENKLWISLNALQKPNHLLRCTLYVQAACY